MAVTPEIPQNIIPNEPDLADVLNMHRKGIFLDLNCHHIGTIKSFNAAKQTATVSINYKKTFFKPNSLGVLQAELKEYPLIADAPVVVLGGGGYALTFPIEKGDECLVLFNDRDLDAWYSGSASSPNPTARLHSFSDALIIVGLRSLPNVIASYGSGAVELRDKTGNTKIKLKDNGKMAFQNPTGEMVDLLFTMLNALTTATAGGFPLVLPPDFATALTKFQSFKE